MIISYSIEIDIQIVETPVDIYIWARLREDFDIIF